MPYQVAIDRRPYGGAAHSFEAMREMARQGEAHPAVRRWAIETTRGVTPKDYLSEVAALYYEIARTVRYVRDPRHTEFVEHPAVMLAQRAGDCDDQAAGLGTGAKVLARQAAANVGLAMAAGAIGNRVQFTAVGFKPPMRPGAQGLSHVFVRVRDPRSGEWAVVDPVAGPLTRKMIAKVQQMRVEDV